MKSVIDASTVLAFCNQEPGGTEARTKMRGGLISAVNLSEVYQKSIERGKLRLAQAIVGTASLEIIPFSESRALMAAEIHGATKGLGISFADRACLALGIIEGFPIIAGDRKWLDLSIDATVELFRPGLN